MPKPLEWAGTIRGQIIEYHVAKMQSGAVAINVTVRVDEYWDADAKEWFDCRSEDFRAEGALWIVGKNGKLHIAKCESLKKHTGWDGTMTSLGGEWNPTPCSFTHEVDSHKGGYSIGFINAYDDAPRATADLQELQNLYGAELRAIAGNVARNAVPTKGKPKAPKPAPALEPAQDLEGPEPSTDDGIPF